MQVNPNYGNACQMWISSIVSLLTIIRQLIAVIVRRQVVTSVQFSGEMPVILSAR